MLRALLTRFVHALPSQCAVCRDWPAQPVCPACVSRFAQSRPRCRTCALPLPEGPTQCGTCIKDPPPLDHCLAAVDYAYPWAGLITRYKFAGDPGWSASFAELLRSAPQVAPTLAQADLLLPMPLSRERLRERGFNQAYEIARRLAPQKASPHLLLRQRHTPAQSSLPRRQRLRNVQGAFALAPQHQHALQNKRVILFDDVMTSGASLFAAAQVLREAGAAHITGLVLARTE